MQIILSSLMLSSLMLSNIINPVEALINFSVFVKMSCAQNKLFKKIFQHYLMLEVFRKCMNKQNCENYFRIISVFRRILASQPSFHLMTIDMVFSNNINY